MPVPSRRRTSRTRSQPAAPATGPVYLTRQVHFCAAHRLQNPGRSKKWNVERYGHCTGPYWHGHNYVLEATVCGTPSAETGFIIDLRKLKQVMEKEIAIPCDHRNLNEDVPFLRDVNPSTENLVVAFWNRLAPRIREGTLYRLRLYETPRNFADYYGPEGRP